MVTIATVGYNFGLSSQNFRQILPKVSLQLDNISMVPKTFQLLLQSIDISFMRIGILISHITSTHQTQINRINSPWIGKNFNNHAEPGPTVAIFQSLNGERKGLAVVSIESKHTAVGLAIGGSQNEADEADTDE